MQEFCANYYQIIKSLHIIAVIAWMAGMLYLPRLFVYHAEAKLGGELSETLKIMEYKLLRYIINPAMIASIIFGVMLLISGVVNIGIWFHIKALAIILMCICHIMLAIYRKKFANDENKKSAKFFRILNEVPTILMIIIVFVTVTKLYL